MIARLIALVGPQSRADLDSARCLPSLPASMPCAPAARRHSRSLRHPGHRLHRVPGQAPQVIEDQVTYPLVDGDADGAEVQGGARLLVLRRLVRLRHLRGRHRHLLGALARARISQRRRAQAAGRRDADARARRDRRRLGLSVRACMATKHDARRAALAAGLAGALRASPRRKAWPKSRASAASSSNTTSWSIRSGFARFDIPLSQGARRHPRAATWTSAAASSSWRKPNSWCAGRGYLKGIADLEQDRAQGRRRHAGPAAGRGARRTRPRRAARHRRTQRRRRGRLRHRGAALRRRMRSTSSRASRRGSPRWPAEPARRRRDRAGLRPLGPHPARHRDAASRR